MEPNRAPDDDPLPNRSHPRVRTAAPLAATGAGEAVFATDFTHVIHSWVEQLSPPDEAPAAAVPRPPSQRSVSMSITKR
jgi:hypothetical protein